MLENKKFIIIGMLIMLCASAFFVAGAFYSCKDGSMKDLRCFAPKPIEIVQVCEYNSIGCFKNCEDFIINDKNAFYIEFGIFTTSNLTEKPDLLD